MWVQVGQKAAGNENNFSARISTVLHFIFPSTTGWCYLTPWHKAGNLSLSLSLMHSDTHTCKSVGEERKVGTSRWRQRIGVGGRERRIIRRREEVWKVTVVPRTTTPQGSSHAALWSITIDLPSASHRHCLPHRNTQLQRCIPQLWVWIIYTSFDLKHTDQMNPYSLEHMKIRGGSIAVAEDTLMSKNCRFFPHECSENSGRFTWNPLWEKHPNRTLALKC